MVYYLSQTEICWLYVSRFCLLQKPIVKQFNSDESGSSNALEGFSDKEPKQLVSLFFVL